MVNNSCGEDIYEKWFDKEKLRFHEMIHWTLSAQEEMVYRAHRILFDNFAHQSSRTPSGNLHLLRDSISTTRFFQRSALMTAITPKKPTSISLLHLKRLEVAYMEPSRLSS